MDSAWILDEFYMDSKWILLPRSILVGFWVDLEWKLLGF